MSRTVSSHWFALVDLFLVILSGMLWVFRPELGILPIIINALIPWAVRIVVGLAPFKRTPFDWLIAIFLITAWVGYWAAYDTEAAWSKVWFIVLAVLMYYALAAQPKENLVWVCATLFCVGFGVSIYFFLTQDFVALPRKVEVVNHIGRRLMEIIPRVGWVPIHPNYVAGIAAITTPFVLYPARILTAKKRNFWSSIVLATVGLGCVIPLLAILVATSRGIIMAIACALGGWIIWQIIRLNGGRLRVLGEAVFPSLILAFLAVVVVFLYLGPANAGSAASSATYGSGSRGELIARSIYLLEDFPFTGGGLNSFPGLYSQYILGIPNFYLPNSHNLFMDIAIEQGLLGGVSILLIFLMGIWFTARAIEKADSSPTRTLSWLTFFAVLIAFVHSMVDDYLYNGPGILLLLSLAGLSRVITSEGMRAIRPAKFRALSIVALILTVFLLIKFNNIRSTWNANLGALQMAKVELAGFPTNQWADSSILPQLKQADASLHSVLQHDPSNRTANHRLGLIALLGQDFQSAVNYLEAARREAPNHRGIIKSLGYSYVWLGDMEKASFLLSKIPEARSELDIYAWWWKTQGLPNLSERALIAANTVKNGNNQE